MPVVRVALANIEPAATADQSVDAVCRVIEEAGERGAQIVCFPECYVPGYRAPGVALPPPDSEFLEAAWRRVAEAAGKSQAGVVLGTERLGDSDEPIATALVVDTDGTVLGFQDKVQLDPSEDGVYAPGSERRVFEVAGVTIGVVVCHEGWRYPETVRWAVRRGATIVFHPHFHPAMAGAPEPRHFADPDGTFHEKAVLCRAAENTCYFVSVNVSASGSSTTSAVAAPDGSLVAFQRYGEPVLLVVDLDLDAATRLLATRLQTNPT